MTLQNISFWFAAFRNRPLWKRLPAASAQKRTVGFIRVCSRILLTQMQLFVRKPGKNIRDMLPIWKRQLVKMAPLSRATSTSRTTTATAGSWKTAWSVRKCRKKKQSLSRMELIQEKKIMTLPRVRTSGWWIPIYLESLSMISLPTLFLMNRGQRYWDARRDMSQNPVDIQEVNLSSSTYHLRETNVQVARTKIDAKRRSINVSVQ